MAKTENRIQAQHPHGKSGTNIEKDKYDIMKTSILTCLNENGATAFTVLMEYVNDHVGEYFSGSAGWYYTTVKLDLEARGLIICDRKVSPQMVKLTGSV